jgi:hypothetical protein
MNVRPSFALFALALLVAQPAASYDYPLSPGAIRDAYFLGTRQTSLGADFLVQYSRVIPELQAGRFTSKATLETPFTQVAIHASKTLGYKAQDAVREFYDKPTVVRLHLDICYKINAPENAVRIKIIQNKKEVFPESSDSSPYYPATDEYTQMPSIGEKVELEFKPNKIESSTLLIVINTPDGQHAETAFDLRTLR